MDNADYYPKLLPVVLDSGALAEDPFVLLDVGCGMGPDPVWRLFGDALHVYGFDANIDEIERLTQVEESPGVHYRAALVGLPDDHPFNVRRAADADPDVHAYFNPWGRTSTMAALDKAWSSGDHRLSETNAWAQARLATEKISLDAFVAEEGITSVDFVKVDTDGSDLEVLHSAEAMLNDTRVLGLMVESSFNGDATESSNSFHNIDRLLKRHGFQLYSLSVNRYSRSALPAPFAFRIYAQTDSGQAFWGDALYLRDPVAPAYQAVGGPELSPGKLLKLACLLELLGLPDCAAEVLLAFRDELGPLVDVEGALDLLTPALEGYPETYAEYVAAFEEDPSRFYPPEANADPAELEPEPTLGDDAKALAHRVALATWSRTPEPVRALLRRSATARR